MGEIDAVPRQQLRQQLRTRRRELTPARRIQGAQILATQLLGLPFAPTAGHVAGYWATDGEIALHAWQVQLPPDCIYCLPVLQADGCLAFAPWQPGHALRSNRFGIPEPDVAADALIDARRMSLVVVPLVAFDRSGNRLGMGGGWYDRSFAFRQHQPAPPWLVGAAYAEQRIEGIEPADWDVRLDTVCTDELQPVSTAQSPP
ncbi:MAG: 5-formyltetrahydrofolate cyclo-ligase [Lysobacter sp.]|nr:5-formyltetrahydrofolate cyclo-ligase [Lysobacter sp.]